MKYLITILLAVYSAFSYAQVNDIDSLDLINLIDHKIDSLIDDFHVPGAVFSLVKDGKSFYTRGVGFQNIEDKTEVDPQLSQFRVASITKTFTSIAIMQLVEQGLLDLHADIRTYLPEDEYIWDAPYSFTIHDLLTHTAGLEGAEFRVCKKAVEEKSLETFVKCSISNQIFEPGTVFNYSNKGYGILGLLIQQKSNMRYEDYIAQHILDPLGMDQSTVYQHTADHSIEHPVQPYYWEEGYVPRQRLFLVNPAASNLNTTGVDMGKFMMMMLDSGRVDGNPILSKSSYELLTSPHFAPAHDFESMGYGVMIEEYKGYKGYNHGGGIDGFGSYYILFPELNIGMFMSESGGQENAAYAFRVIYDVLKELVIEKESIETSSLPIELAITQAKEYEGRYQNTTVSKSTFERGQMLFGINEQIVKHEGEGILSFGGTLYRPIDKDTYQKIDGNRKIGFYSNHNGLYMNERIYWTFEKINWYESAITLRISTILSLLGMLIGLVIRPLWMAKKNGRSLNIFSAISIGSIGMIVGFGLLLIGYAFNISLTTETPFIYQVGLWMTTLGVVISCIYPVELIKRWKALNQYDRFWALFNMASVILLMTCFWSVKLIGFNYY